MASSSTQGEKIHHSSKQIIGLIQEVNANVVKDPPPARPVKIDANITLRPYPGGSTNIYIHKEPEARKVYL